MTKHPSYRARDQPESGSASQHRKEKTMHKFEKRDAKSRTLVILAVVGLAAALTAGIFTAVRMFHKPAQSKDDPKTGIVYDDSAIEGGWDNLSPEEIAEKLNEKVAEGMINISMNTAPYFEDGTAEGNVMIVNESSTITPSRSSSSATIPANRSSRAKQSPWAAKSNVLPSMWSFRLAHTNAQPCSTILIRSVAKSSARPGQLSQSQFNTNFNQRSYYNEEH